MSNTKEEKFTETINGTVIEVYRSEEDEKIHGVECWVSTCTSSDGEEITESCIFDCAEKCLVSTRTLLIQRFEQKEITSQFLELIQNAEARGLRRTGILNGLIDALTSAGWKEEVMKALDKAIDFM